MSEAVVNEAIASEVRHRISTEILYQSGFGNEFSTEAGGPAHLDYLNCGGRLVRALLERGVGQAPAPALIVNQVRSPVT